MSQGKPLKSNSLNDLETSDEWVRHLHSIREYEWRVPKELAPHLKMGVLTPPPLAADIIKFYTKAYAQVFDPFAGEAGILVGAALAGRLGAGCDLYEENREAARAVGEHYGFPAGKGWWGMQTADAVDWLRYMAGERGHAGTQDLLFADPPFGINHGRAQDKGGSVPFNMIGTDERDIGTFKSYDDYYQYLQLVARYSYQLLKPGSYALWQLGDRNRGGHYRMVPAEVVPYIEAEGFVLKGVQHFVQRPLNTRRQVFGWGRAYVSLIDHWSLLIFRKEPNGRAKRSFALRASNFPVMDNQMTRTRGKNKILEGGVKSVHSSGAR